MPPAQPPVLSLAAIERTLSRQRLDAYAAPGDHDESERVARYLWNMALSASLHPSLHLFEVTLRNAIYGASVKLVDTSELRLPDIPCWLDAGVPLLYQREAEEVARAKAGLRPDPAGRTPGHLISRLPLGFWVQLLSRGYGELRGDGPRLWPRGLPLVFPFRWSPGARKGAPSHADRQMVFERLQEIRTVRNRVAHHDPIWNCGVAERYEWMLEMMAWMSQRVATAVRRYDAFPHVLSRGMPPYRRCAERLMRSAPRADPASSE